MKHCIQVLTCFVSLFAFLACSPAEAARKSKADQEREAKWQELKKKAEATKQPASKNTTSDTGKEDTRQPVDDGSGTGSGNEQALLIIDLKQLAEWMKESEPTPVQVKAYNRYKTARTTYDSFLAKSAEMVKLLDRSTGPAREDLLNKLRLRKNEEQPIAGELRKAQAELLAAFPEIKREPAKK